MSRSTRLKIGTYKYRKYAHTRKEAHTNNWVSPGYVPDGVTAATQHQHRNAETFDKGDAFPVTLDTQIEASKPIAAQRIRAALKAECLERQIVHWLKTIQFTYIVVPTHAFTLLSVIVTNLIANKLLLYPHMNLSLHTSPNSFNPAPKSSSPRLCFSPAKLES